MLKEIYADKVLFNGKIITVNKNDDICEAVAVSNNKIIYVGDNNTAKEYIGPDTVSIDLEGRSVTPGFIDAHVHFTELCLQTGGIFIPVGDANSIDEIKQILAEAVKNKKEGQWIYLTGYNHNTLADRRHPTLHDLDEVAPNNPVKCIRLCHHMCVYNSYALRLAGIDDTTVFERPEEIEYDENGKITGLFKEASMDLVAADIILTNEEYKHAFECVNNLFAPYGITGVHDPGAGMSNTGRNMLQEALKRREVKMRVYAMYCSIDSREKGFAAINRLAEFGPHTGIGDEWFKMGPIKLLLDGSTSAPSCFTKEPYCHNPELKRLYNFPDQDELNETLLRAFREGFQVTSHAVGDAAVEHLIEAYEYISEREPIENRRFRIEHCGITNKDLIKRMKALNIIPISNPMFITANGKNYNEFFGERTEYMFAHRSYKEEGIIEGFGSDCPASPLNPMFSLYGAVTRKDIGNNEVCGGSQKTDLLSAIRSHTYNNAYASFEEDIKGSIEEGKLADMVVLSEDILSCDPEHIKDIKVDMTMLDGEIIFERK